MIYSELDDGQLLILLEEGDGEAFAEIYNRYWKLLYSTAHNIIQNDDLAKDAVQEVFVSIWVRRAEAEIKALRAYLQQAVRFQILKFIRDQKADERFYSRLADVTTDIFFHNPLLLKEQQVFLLQLMNGLPEDCRTVFNLSREEQLTYKQIASRLEISEKTVEKKISICLRHIRQALQADRALCVAIAFAISFPF